MQDLKKLIASSKIKDAQDTAASIIQKTYCKDWIVYAKAPFGGPQQVVQYLAQYTHKVAISNKRIVEANAQQVAFKYKDYTDDGKHKIMTLSTTEFIRRFEMHILPARFCKIRSYGYLANRNRHKNIAAIKVALQLPASPPAVKVPFYIRLLEQYNTNYLVCPCCAQATLVLKVTEAINDS